MNASKQLTRNLPSYSLIEMGDFRFPWLPSDSSTEKEQDRPLLALKYVLSANSGAQPQALPDGICKRRSLTASYFESI